MKGNGLMIVVVLLISAIVAVLYLQKRAQQKEEIAVRSYMQGQSLTASEQAQLMLQYFAYKQAVDSLNIEKEFRWKDLFMGQAAVSEGVGNIFLGMGNITSM